jgi:hypothetical protein
MITRRSAVKLISGATLAAGWMEQGHAQGPSLEQVSAIAKQAFIHGYPMVAGYATMYTYAIDKNNPQYKAPFNQIANVARVFTPQDAVIITPNSDTPYSFIWADLRGEPLVWACQKSIKDAITQFNLLISTLTTSPILAPGPRVTALKNSC